MKRKLKFEHKTIIAFFAFLIIILTISVSVVFSLNKTTNKNGVVKEINYSKIQELKWINDSTYLDDELYSGASNEMFNTIQTEFNKFGIFGPEITSLRNIFFTDDIKFINQKEESPRGIYIPTLNIIKINIKTILDVVKRKYSLTSDEINELANKGHSRTEINSNIWDKMEMKDKMFALKNSILKTIRHEYLHHLANSYLRQPTEEGKILNSNFKDVDNNYQLENDFYYNEEKTNYFLDNEINNKQCDNSITGKNYKDSVIAATNKDLKILSTDGLMKKIDENGYSYFPLPYYYPHNPHNWSLTFNLYKEVTDQRNYILSFEEQFARSYNWLLMFPSIARLNRLKITSITLGMRGLLCAGWNTIEDRNKMYSSLLKIINYGQGISNIWYEKTKAKNFKIEGYVNNDFLLNASGQLRKFNWINFTNKVTGKVITKKITIPWSSFKNSSTYNKNIYNWNTSVFINNQKQDWRYGPTDEQLFRVKWNGDPNIEIDKNVAFYSEMINVENDFEKGEYTVDINGHKISSSKSIFSNFDFDGTNSTEKVKKDGSSIITTNDLAFQEIAKKISIKNPNGEGFKFNIPYLKENFPYFDKEKTAFIIE